MLFNTFHAPLSFRLLMICLMPDDFEGPVYLLKQDHSHHLVREGHG